MTKRKILHFDLDAFFCAVEELRDPTLKGKSFAVGGRPESRGVVSSCSYAARSFGVHSAMPMARALQLCPGLIIISSARGAYEIASRRIMDILKSYTPLVEQVSIDEAFLDLSDLPTDAHEIAREIQMRIHRETQLPCSIGVASNKLVAKIATNVGKAAHHGAGYPNAIQVVEPGEEAEFLAHLSVRALWGVGPKTAGKLEKMGIHRIGQLSSMSESSLMAIFGKNGLELSRHSKGIDDSPVMVEHEIKSISQEVTFDKDVADEGKLIHMVQMLTEQVAFRLRQESLCANTLKIKLRWPDFSTITRQMTFVQPTDQDKELFNISTQLFYQTWQKGKSVRLLGVGVSNLKGKIYQPSLWESPETRERKILQAIDHLRDRYGKQVIRRGRIG